MKSVSKFGLRDGTQAEYKRRHDQLWPEMAAMIRRAGLERYSIWNLGDMLIEYYECDDPAVAGKIIAADPIKAKWDEYMRDILVFDDGETMTPLRCLFDFDNMGGNQS